MRGAGSAAATSPAPSASAPAASTAEEGGEALLVQFYEQGAKCDGTKLRRSARVDYAP